MRRLSPLLTLVLVGLAALRLAAPADSQREPAPAIAQQCRLHLSRTLKVPVGDVKVVKVDAVNWPDASLGHPEPGKMYAQVVTPGWRLVLEARGERHIYAATDRRFVYGGPEDVATGSVLYIRPAANEPNTNGDLYQASIQGGRPVLLYRGVSAFVPGPAGKVLAVRRDSRSGHSLLLLQQGPSLPMAASVVHSALAYGEIALNADGSRWAAFVRPALGSGWLLALGDVPRGRAGATPPRTVALPGGSRPGRLEWAGGALWASLREGAAEAGYRVATRASGGPAFDRTDDGPLGGGPGIMLNKSETLLFSAGTRSGQPEARLVRRWFTGSERVVTTVPSLKMEGYTLRQGEPLGLVWGEQNGRPTAYVVDLRAARAYRAAVGLTGRPAIWQGAPAAAGGATPRSGIGNRVSD